MSISTKTHPLRALRYFLWLLGLAGLVWALVDPRFRDPEGFVSKEFCLALSMALALFLLGWAIINRWRDSAFWLALAAVGQALTLQLIEAGRALHYQHYAPVERLFAGTNLLVLFLIGVQALLVLAGLWRRLPVVRAWLGAQFRPWQLLGIGLAFCLPVAAVSRALPSYVSEFGLAAFLQTLNLGNIILVGWTLPPESLSALKMKLETWLGRADINQAGTVAMDWFPWASAAFVISAAAALSLFVYQAQPHIPDEVAYLYHARFLAAGALTLPAPPVPEGFEIALMELAGGRWFPAPPPGWPAVLAVGVLVGAPWLVNPVLAGLNLLLIYQLIQDAYDRRTARLTVGLLCVSPWYLFMAMNFMTHTFTLTCGLGAAVGLARVNQTGRARWALVSGLAVGVTSLIRPLDGFIVAGLLGIRAIGIGGRRLSLSAIFGLVLGSIAFGAIQLPYNQALTGSAAVFPINMYDDERYGVNSNAYGFGADRGMGWPLDPYPGHGPVDALINANLNSFSINIELFGWSSGSLLLAELAVLSGRLKRNDYAMLAILAAVFGAYFFYYFSGGPDFGARYWILMIVPLGVLTVRGLQFLEERIDGARILITLLAVCLLTVVNYFPWRVIDKYFHYLDMRPDIRDLARAYDFGRSLVLIRGERFPDYSSAAIYNPLDLQAAEPIYAWDRSPQVEASLLRAYPDRPIWISNGPSITGAGYRVLAGPLPAHDLPALPPPPR